MNINILEGDCFDLIKQQPDNSVDLVITSQPYADIVNYGKDVSVMNTDEYVDWLLPLFVEIERVLKPTGSFILNINDKCNKGYRSTFIYDLISRNNKEKKLKLYDTYIWYKKSGIPNGALKRFRNNTEFIFHFCKDSKKLKFYMDRILSKSVNSDEMVRPDNVVRFSTAGASRDNHIKHPAPFHKELPLYYIKALTDENDVVLDPFSGIATTGLACKELNRDYIGYELNSDYVNFSRKRLTGESEKWVINKYSLDGEFLKSYENRSQAFKDNPECSSEEDIMRCYARNNRNTCGGFIWRKEKLNDDDNYVINQYTLQGEFIKSFKSPTEACKEIDYVSFHNIMMCYRGLRSKAGGFIWRKEKI